MSTIDLPAGRGEQSFLDRIKMRRTRTSLQSAASPDAAVAITDIVKPDSDRKSERFIPITRYALLERLTNNAVWPSGQATDARRFFRYLDYWRQQQYNARLFELEQCYEPFSPDSDLLLTRAFSDGEKSDLQTRVIGGVAQLLTQANYVRIDPAQIEMIMTRDSHYGLDLFVDMKAFDEVMIYYRGASNRRDAKRLLRRFMRREEFDIPIFQRLFLLFKLKPLAQRVAEYANEHRITTEEAEKRVKKLRAQMPAGIKDSNIYLKLFKNIPRTDLEMVFPNTQVRFRMLDKLRLGLTTGGGLGMGAFGAAGKLALLTTNPFAAAGAIAGLGAVAFRQTMAFMNQKQRYMVVMAQNLYFHAMADNRGVILKIGARAAEEDIKEEMLLYAVLAKERSRRQDLPEIDAAIEQYLVRTFGVRVDFDLDDALSRLVADGIVRETADGTLETLSPKAACDVIDAKWDRFLDDLPDVGNPAGSEVDAQSPGPSRSL